MSLKINLSRSINTESNKKGLSPTLLRLIAVKLKKTSNPSPSGGFSLIELITVVAGLAILTSISITGLINTFISLEIDEVQAHLNSLAVDCLKISSNMADSKGEMPAPTSVDNNLLSKNGYAEKEDNTCSYFQVDPKDINSKTHFSMGFGVTYGKVTKFAIKDAAKTADIVAACQSWAGDGNCLENGSDYSEFFTHMDDVRIARATCNINLRNYLNSTPPPDPIDGGDKKTWDSESDQDCRNKTLPANATSYKTNCKKDGCTKEVKIKKGKIVGYTEAEYNQAQTLECSNSIITYINSDSYDGGAEIKEGLAGCTEKKYICDYREHKELSFKDCEIQTAISACNRDLEEKRKAMPNAEIKVSGSGLPPCGQTYCVIDGVIREGKCGDS